MNNDLTLISYISIFVVAVVAYFVGTLALDKKGDGPAIDKVLRERLFGLSKCIILVIVAGVISYIYYLELPLHLLKALIPLSILSMMYACYKVIPNMFSPMVESYYTACSLHGKSIGRRASIIILCISMATITIAGAISIYRDATYAGPSAMPYVLEYTAVNLSAAGDLQSALIASVIVSNRCITTAFLFVGVLSCVWLLWHEMHYTAKVHQKLKRQMLRYYLCLVHKLLIVALVIGNLTGLLFLQLSVNSIVSLVESDVAMLLQNLENYDIHAIAAEAAHYFSTDMLASPINCVLTLNFVTRIFVLAECSFIVLKILCLVYTKHFIYKHVKANEWSQYQTLVSVLSSSLTLRGIHNKKGSSKLILDFYTYLLPYTKMPMFILFLTIVQVNTSFLSAFGFMHEVWLIKKEYL